ncbi:hypothetical protein AB0A73_13720 [Glycomyces sp. NPDC047369]
MFIALSPVEAIPLRSPCTVIDPGPTAGRGGVTAAVGVGAAAGFPDGVSTMAAIATTKLPAPVSQLATSTPRKPNTTAATTNPAATNPPTPMTIQRRERMTTSSAIPATSDSQKTEARYAAEANIAVF